MADLTLFELHVHDGLDFSPSSVIGGRDDAEDDEETGAAVDVDGPEDEEESGGGAGRAVAALIGLAFLVLAGVAVRKVMSDDLDPIEELEELDEAVEA